MMSKQTRNVPTYYLNEQGYRKIKNAIASEFPDGYGLEDLAVTVSKNNDSLHIDTISKIINRTEKVRKSSIKTLFEAFYILLIDNDLTRDLPIINNFEDDPNFVGRNNDITSLDNLTNKGAKIIQIIAPGGTGKTILASKYLESKFKTVLEFPIGKEIKDIASIENLLAEKLRELGEEPGREFMVSLCRLKQKLQTQEIGILIDNLEPALDASGKFIEQHRSYVELLRVLTDSRVKSLTLITSREPLCEGLDITPYNLPCLTVEAWREYWHYQGINMDTPILKKEIHKAYGGNALAMKVLCNTIYNDLQGDIVAYWHNNKTEENLEVETAVANLIKEQFERLSHINLDAYNLLCRMGCYRYQDVQTVPEKGLCSLLWNVDENQHKRIIKVLKERGLVEFNNDEYWLHTVIRKEAIEKLRNSEDWEKANTQAGEFWTASVKSVETVEDARKAFEAYHHYVSINDFEQAGYVIIERRNFSGVYDEHLGRSFYRLGLLTTMIAATNLIESNIKEEYLLASIYNISGVIYRILGSIGKAINYHYKSLEIVNNLKNNQINVNYEEIELLILKARLNLSFCFIDIGQLKKAIYNFKKFERYLETIKTRNQSSYLRSHEIYAQFYLAFLYSCFNSERRLALAESFAKKVSDNLYNTQFSLWSKGYCLFFLGLTYKNLEQRDKSCEMYKEAIEYAKESHYIQVEAKALTGLAELYRIQNEIETALDHHQKSIEILDKIGAKCDLAEAYFQLALTYQKIGDKASSEEYFNKALYLWSPEQIDAPKQIERVLKAMNCES